MLLLSGRKRLQTVLIEPKGTSVNSGDVFILVTNKELFQWVGSKVNIMEMARVSCVQSCVVVCVE